VSQACILTKGKSQPTEAAAELLAEQWAAQGPNII
jgi:hypothetical protein